MLAQEHPSPSRPAQRRLIALLALERGRPVESERLIDRFWSEEAPPGAKASLQTHISAIRRLLGADVIATEARGYRLNLDVAVLDVEEFQSHVEAARQAASDQMWEIARERSAEALELWRGTPFPELADDEFARPEIVRLDEIRQQSWELWAESLLRLGRFDEAVPELERLVVEYPYRERLWEHLMTALYRSGRHAEALAAFRRLAEHLAEIGLEPGPSLQRLEERILLHDEELSAPPHNLPRHLTTFIGRDDEKGDIIKMLADHRLVTLTGVGGAGKTRLAVEVGIEDLGSFPEGCWFVGLADLTDPARVPIEVASALGLPPHDEHPLESLVGAVRHSEMLIVLDNCEHVAPETAAVVRRLMNDTRGVRVLATSREPLRIPGEVLYDVPPLDTPPIDLAPLDVAGFDAVRLFVDRASLVDRRFRPHEAYPHIAQICRKLEGIPLAIELAAAKVRTFSAEAIERGLGQRLLSLGDAGTPAPTRHQTLETAVAWSYELLDETQQELLCRLSVFRGGFDLEMVEALAPDATAPTAGLESLVDKSLVARDQAVPDRYRLLEPVRQFAEERLIRSGLETEVRERHLQWCVQFATELEGAIYGPGQRERLDRLGTEVDNLSGALTVAESKPDSDAISRVASALAWHWLDLGTVNRSRVALLSALAHAGDDPLREADLRSRLGYAYWLLRDGEAALREESRAYRLVGDLGPSPQKAWVLSRYASLFTLMVDEDPGQAIDLAREALAVAEASQAPVVEIRVRAMIGQALSWAGEVDEGFEMFMRALDDAIALGDPATTLRTYGFMGDVVYHHPEKRRDLPRKLIGDMLTHFPPDEWEGHIEFGWLAWVFLQSGEWDKAEDAIRRSRKPGIEGYERENALMTWGTLSWMRGDLETATAVMADLEREGVNPRFYHDYYPLRTDIAADTGDLESARRTAETYLAVDVDPSEQSRKLGALHPLVRAEVNAAMASTGTEREDHIARAVAAVERMKTLLADYPAPSEGSVAMETHGTHLAFARAELSRPTAPDPDLWREVADRADYAYFRLYARIRLAEALALSGRPEAASEVMEEARGEVLRVGAHGLGRLLDRICHGINKGP